MSQLSLAEAKRLSLKKWEMVVKDNGKSKRADNDPELRDLKNHCGFCERHSYPRLMCGKCEINRGLDHGCFEYEHPFDDWMENPTKKTAQAVLDLIKSVKV